MAERPHVLLVDDEDRMLKALRRALRRLPIEVETAPDARRALDRLAKTPEIGLVVSDLKMPGMDGLALLGRVRHDHPEIGRILLSGWASEVSKAEARAAGLYAVLSKPWDDAELKAAIRGALDLG